ncbi:Hypothetical protein SMAX5B_019351 [Scophthalmus maximus]|uniref:Uncharacterized protein n=1 Tax=Scophthalmus maximus TaxID=52904 RepID=A0A2U9BVX7_SCOMX|nr:Hypothetical protein SMAX5B_019351 [Scophthalmus maximus]
MLLGYLSEPVHRDTSIIKTWWRGYRCSVESAQRITARCVHQDSSHSVALRYKDLHCKV